MQVQVSELHLATHSVSPSLLSPSFSSSIHPSHSFFLPGCQAMVGCHSIEWYSKELKVCSGSRHLHSCCCCYHWYPTYYIWLLLPCTAGGDLCCHGYRFFRQLIISVVTCDLQLGVRHECIRTSD